MCLRICRVPTRSLSLLVSSLGSKKASSRSGEQQAAGQHAHQTLSNPLLLVPCLCPKLPRTEFVYLGHSGTGDSQDSEVKDSLWRMQEARTPWPSISPQCFLEVGRVRAQGALIPTRWYHTVHVRLRPGVTRTSGLFPTVHGELTRDPPQRSSCFWAGLQVENNSQALSS